MKRGGIINHGLSEVIARLGHGQILMVADAGCPIPLSTRCIDLSIVKGVPTLEQVLSIIDTEIITEKVMFAHQVKTNNPKLYEVLQRIFSDADFEGIDHANIIGKYAHQAVAIVRTGDYNPWGNIVLVAGTDPYAFFQDESIVIPEFYKQRFQQVQDSGKKGMFDTKNFTRTDV